MLEISKQQIATLPTAVFPGRSILIDNPSDARSALAYLNRQKILGFDTETRPSFKKGANHKVALLQLSTESECFLLRLNKIGINDAMIALFENPEVMKVGLSIKDDFHSMTKVYGEFNPANIVELQSFVKDYDIADNSLQKVYAIIFGERISKGQRLTNWEADQLTEAQQAYASLDAYACLRIYNHLLSGAFDIANSPYIVAEE